MIPPPSLLALATMTKHKGSLFFSNRAMRLTGDTFDNYRTAWDTIQDEHGKRRKVIRLDRQRPVKRGQIAPAYFDRETFERVWPA